VNLKYYEVFHNRLHCTFQREPTGIAGVEASHSRSDGGKGKAEGAGIMMINIILLRQVIPMTAKDLNG